VDYLKPTPMNVELELRGRVSEIRGRKVVVQVTLFAAGVATVKGEVAAVQMPKTFLGG
jgi:acyl-CoA thioesterase FadM